MPQILLGIALAYLTFGVGCCFVLFMRDKLFLPDYKYHVSDFIFIVFAWPWVIVDAVRRNPN